MTERDMSTVDLEVGASMTAHQNVYLGEALIARVEVSLLVLEADDGRVSLLVDQDTQLTPDVSVEDLRSHS